jgi:aquaporin Z
VSGNRVQKSQTLAEMNIPALAVEFLGTFIFLYVIVATGNPWAIGGTLAVLAYLGGAISGGHFNPAVTVMMFVNKSVNSSTAVAYIVAQVTAGLLALAAYKKLKL